MWVCLPDLPLELWETSKILKLVSIVGTSLFADERTAAATSRMGFARMVVTIDIIKPMCLGAKVKLDDTTIWQ